MKKMIKLFLYLSILTLIALYFYSALSTFPRRYRVNAAEVYAAASEDLSINNKLYRELLNALHIDPGDAPQIHRSEEPGNEDLFFSDSNQTCLGYAVIYDNLVEYISGAGAFLFITFLYNTVPFAGAVVLLSICLAIMVEYYDEWEILRNFPHVIEGIPPILILLWFHAYLKTPSAWYGALSFAMTPVCYRPVAAMIKDYKNKNIIDGERMYAEPESRILLKLILQSWPLLLSQFFYFFSIAIMMDTCMNFLAPFDFGEPTISSCLGRMMDVSRQDLGILNTPIQEMRNEILSISIAFILFFIMCQKSVLTFSSRK